jgi:sec-independent protein translocase protein TatC
MTKILKTKKHQRTSQAKAAPTHLTFSEHLAELRRRLFYISAAVIAGSMAAYLVQQQIVNALVAPAHNQKFIYTSPIGGIDFLFRVCLYTGLALSIPVIIYNCLKYIEPLMAHDSARFIAWSSLASGVLALAGIIFGYFIGLPTALHFLLHQFSNHQITAMLTIQSYLSFVTLYMFGAALMFQLPLILLLTNRIKPLTPGGMWRKERWVILASFVLAIIMNPTPNLIGQVVLAGPMIVAYQLAIGLVALLQKPAPAVIAEPIQPKTSRIIAQPKLIDVIVNPE